MDKLKDQGMRQVILDMRGNPGGLLNQAIDVASEFLPRGLVVVSVKGRTEYSDAIVYKSTGSDPEVVPLVVLINRGTASASEIVAGAIQDHDRGLIVGETSFGKGLVQHVFLLPFSTGLTLTTAASNAIGRSLQPIIPRHSTRLHAARRDTKTQSRRQPRFSNSQTLKRHKSSRLNYASAKPR